MKFWIPKDIEKMDKLQKKVKKTLLLNST